jgi:hypothetical protein
MRGQIPLRLIVCLTCFGVLALRPLSAQETFTVMVEPEPLQRELQRFEVLKADDGYILFELVSPVERHYLEQARYLLGRTNEAGGFTPVAGEPVWLATLPGTPGQNTYRILARMPSAELENAPVEDLTLISVKPEPGGTDPVDGAIEAADALVRLQEPDAAVRLLRQFAEDSRHRESRCRVLEALLDLQVADQPPTGNAIPSDVEATLHSLLTTCQGAEAEAAARVLTEWTLARVTRLLESDSSADPDPKILLRDALNLVGTRPGGDGLLLALARAHERQGYAEEGSQTIEQFLKTYPGSPLREEARDLQAALNRRVPASGYRNAGTVGPSGICEALDIRELTALRFDSEGHLLILDGKSKPRQVLCTTIRFPARTLEILETVGVSKEWDPVDVDRSTDGTFYVVETDDDQLLALHGGNPVPKEELFAKSGEDWKLRNARRVSLLQDREILVFDPSSEAIHRFLPGNLYVDSIDLKGFDFRDALDFSAAPDGQILVVNEEGFSLFAPDSGPKEFRRALLGNNEPLRISGCGTDRWRYVYLFDRKSERLEKFRRNGNWLTTVIDCPKEGIEDPDLWTVSPEGDIVLYDRKTDALYLFAQ